MSYILDALRKADAERERGHVPGINAQPTFAGHAKSHAAPAARPWVWAVMGLLAALLVGAALWVWLGGGAARGAATTAAVPMATAVPPAVAAKAATPEPMPSVAATSAVVTPAPVAPTPAPIARAIAPAASPSPVVSGRAAEAAAVVPKAKPATSAPQLAAPSAKPASAAVAQRVYAIEELPDDIRRQLPPISVGGSAYSAKAADRIVIINGQILHEGDRVTPDLVLQQIRLKAALLAFKGYVYTLNF